MEKRRYWFKEKASILEGVQDIISDVEPEFLNPEKRIQAVIDLIMRLVVFVTSLKTSIMNDGSELGDQQGSHNEGYSERRLRRILAEYLPSSCSLITFMLRLELFSYHPF